RPISLAKLQCIGILAELGQDIPDVCMHILRAILCRNEFIWHGRGDQKRVLESVRMSLDFASFSLDKHHGRSEMTEDEMVRRWPATQDWFTARRLTESALSFKMDRAPE